jgi:6-phosphofructokinase 1
VAITRGGEVRTTMRVGILTGGGDVPGLNSSIKAAVERAHDDGVEVLGLKRGWAGLLNLDAGSPDSRREHTIVLTPDNTRTIDRSGGTFLHTSRTHPGRVRPADLPEFLRTEFSTPGGDGRVDCTPHVLRTIERLGLDGLIAIGGDDTLSYAVRLDREGVPLVCIPKTMDNDVRGTDYCIGFSTAVTRSIEMIHDLRTSAGSHERIVVVELFGRYSGETSLITAYLAGVDRAVISEVEFDLDRLIAFLVADREANPSRYAIVTVSEGARPVGGALTLSGEADAYGHKKLGGVGLALAHEIERRTRLAVLYQQLAYLMRSGAPDALDRMVATSYGHLAAELLIRRERGVMVALRNGCYATVPLATVTAGPKCVDVAELYDSEQYRPKVSHLLGKPMFLY